MDDRVAAASLADGASSIRHVAVLLDGPCEATPLLRSHLVDAHALAADGGMRHAAPLGFVGERSPIAWLGDFDGAQTPGPDEWPDVPRERFPAAKDMTDGEIAARAALSLGPDRLTLVGALGGPRLDHALAAVMLGVSLAERDAALTVTMTDGRQWVRPLLADRPVEARIEEGPLLSVVALGPLCGLELSGVAWPLDGAAVALGESRPLSNEIVEPRARASLRVGRAILVTGPGDG